MGGLWTWNDKDRKGAEGWMEAPVPAKLYWAVKGSNFRLGDQAFGCDDPSCAAVIDTGTSLVTPPTAAVTKLTNIIHHLDGVKDCSDLSLFPDFNFKLGDHEFSLPPTSYIADAGVQEVKAPEDSYHQLLALRLLPMTKEDLRLAEKAKETGEPEKIHMCGLMVSGSGNEQTQIGPMMIMGMPFFRKYATQFDLSGDLQNQEGKRVMRFAESEDDCSRPVKKESTGKPSWWPFKFKKKTQTLQKVNLDKLRVSPWQQNLKPTGKHGAKLHQKDEILRI